MESASHPTLPIRMEGKCPKSLDKKYVETLLVSGLSMRAPRFFLKFFRQAAIWEHCITKAGSVPLRIGDVKEKVRAPTVAAGRRLLPLRLLIYFSTLSPLPSGK